MISSTFVYFFYYYINRYSCSQLMAFCKKWIQFQGKYNLFANMLVKCWYRSVKPTRVCFVMCFHRFVGPVSVFQRRWVTVIEANRLQCWKHLRVQQKFIHMVLCYSDCQIYRMLTLKWRLGLKLFLLNQTILWDIESI